MPSGAMLNKIAAISASSYFTKHLPPTIPVPATTDAQGQYIHVPYMAA